MRRAPLVRLVAAAASVAAATCALGPVAEPAAAAACGSSTGVTVVVDPGALGGALTSACDAGSGQTASDRFADVGVVLDYVQRQPGFVCRVDGAPASEPCVNTPPADAYWALWWSDGKNGAWSYASIGATGLRVPEGGAVALAWQQGSARRVPATAAPAHASPTSSPSTTAPKPTRSPTTRPTATATRPAPAVTASDVPSATPSPSAASPSARDGASGVATSAPRPRVSGKPKPPPARTSDASPRGGAPSSTASTEAAPRAQGAGAAEPVAASGRAPTWVTLGVLVLLLVAIAAMAWAARRRTHGR
ncbi:hypothetical protein [Nocardioides piscis]|uniref:DUF4430 domain-containing protein n=1 Tax=Nocardioides piscis TaxID=2714938 RepID=A0A6G7YJZ7_9ACTN|nr:hypothetical protein [Nocardioides piscis]QIK77057.1 hypothetical protein G7071_18070 [Nocardioides piscis]